MMEISEQNSQLRWLGFEKSGNEYRMKAGNKVLTIEEQEGLWPTTLISLCPEDPNFIPAKRVLLGEASDSLHLYLNKEIELEDMLSLPSRLKDFMAMKDRIFEIKESETLESKEKAI